jgi:polyprenyl-phospho-N-acetylgalactosaminyl synthase
VIPAAFDYVRSHSPTMAERPEHPVRFAPGAVHVVIAAFNEAKRIGDIVSGVRAHYPNVTVVDDGSRDGTAEIAAGRGAWVLRHLINRGQGAALKTGIEGALARGAQAIVTFDADGQHRVEDISRLLAALEGGYDVALGSRFLGDGGVVPWGRRIVLKLGVLFTRVVSGLRVTDTHNGLRALSRHAAETIEIRQDRMAHASEILDEIARHELRCREVPTRVEYTAYSRGKGQHSSAAFLIALDFLVGRWEK